MTYAIGFPGEPEKLDIIEIHKSAAQVAREAYRQKYGIDYHDDPEWAIGSERHSFWLDAFTSRQTSLVLDPHQS